jgi:DNA-binding transcriptional MerR regulator
VKPLEYTVQKLADLAGITSRTVRYYDEIDLLKPKEFNSSGYRVYGKKEVDKLQQILFFKEMDLDLDTIKKIIDNPDFNEIQALKKHRNNLFEKKKRLEKLIENVDKSIKTKKRGIKMSDKEKFEGFKKQLIEENENKYGDEIRKKYGEEVVNKSNEKVKNMSKEDYKKVKEIEEELFNTLKDAIKTNDPSRKLGQKAADLHKKWLSFYWDTYTKQAHAGLAQMYVSDERFKSYYDEKVSGSAEFLKEAILIYTGMDE